MPMCRLIQAIRWVSTMIWSYLARPFRRTSKQMELPTASPIPPSTPSFIQRDEPDISVDAMRIFHMNYGPPRVSRIARNKSVLTELRSVPPPPTSDRVASLCSTEPSPGFSLLNDVVDAIASSEPDCPSPYSSPPSSPSSSLHTPCIVVSTTMGEIAPERDDGPSGLYIRPPLRPAYASNSSRESFYSLSAAPRPRSALATVADFMRASHVSPRGPPSREAFLASPESQVAFTENDPFSVNAESFFVEDCIHSPSAVGLYDVGIYSDSRSLLNLQPPKRQQTAERGRHKRQSSSYMAPNSFGKPVVMGGLSVRGSRVRPYAEDPNPEDLTVKPRILSGAVEKSSANDEGSPNGCLSSVQADMSDTQSMLARYGLYASLIFPFSLEDSVSLDDTTSIPHVSDSVDIDKLLDRELDQADSRSVALPISLESVLGTTTTCPDVVHNSAGNDLDGLEKCLQTALPLLEPANVNRRRERRIGIYGGVPSPWPVPHERSESPCLISAERRKASIEYAPCRDSKRGSPYRPLVLPKRRLAVRDVDGLGRGSPPVSANSSIGRPPPFPLPEVPTPRSSATAKSASTPLPAQFRTVYKGRSSSSHGLEPEQRHRPYWSPASMPPTVMLDDENSGSNYSVNWSIAF